MSSLAAAPVSSETLQKILSAIGSVERWRILQELAKGEALPVKYLAKRVGIPETNVSKLMALFRSSGIVERTPSRAYRINPRFAVPGEQAVDLGVMLLRFDRVSGN